MEIKKDIEDKYKLEQYVEYEKYYPSCGIDSKGESIWYS